MKQQFLCPTCGYHVAYGTLFCGKCGNTLFWQQIQQPLNYQQPVNYQQQLPPGYRLPSNGQPIQEMNWFQKHLNWTSILSYFSAPPIWIILGFWKGFTGIGISYETLTILGNTISLIIILIVSGWVIKQKGRSLWWIFLYMCFSPIWLNNKIR